MVISPSTRGHVFNIGRELVESEAYRVNQGQIGNSGFRVDLLTGL